MPDCWQPGFYTGERWKSNQYGKIFRWRSNISQCKQRTANTHTEDHKLVLHTEMLSINCDSEIVMDYFNEFKLDTFEGRNINVDFSVWTKESYKM